MGDYPPTAGVTGAANGLAYSEVSLDQTTPYERYAAPTKSEVESAYGLLDRQSALLEVLANELGNHQERIAGVLTPPYPNDKQDRPGHPVHFSDRLLTNNARLDEAIAFVRQLTERVGL